MLNGYRTGVLVTSLLLISQNPARAAKVHPAPVCTVPPASVAQTQLYSPRALRRARTLLQLRMLELREERLRRVEEALRRALPPDLLPKTGDSGS